MSPIGRLIDLYSLVLGPIRRVLPPLGGLDFSGMALLLFLQVLKGFIR